MKEDGLKVETGGAGTGAYVCTRQRLLIWDRKSSSGRRGPPAGHGSCVSNALIEQESTGDRNRSSDSEVNQSEIPLAPSYGLGMSKTC